MWSSIFDGKYFQPGMKALESKNSDTQRTELHNENDVYILTSYCEDATCSQ